MHIPLIGQLATHLLPFVHPPAHADSLTFRPLHAHAHTTDAQLLLHDASRHPSAYTALSGNNDEAYLADRPLTLRTRPTIIRRPRVRPPSMISWATSAQRKAADGIFIPWSGNVTDMWNAPDMLDAEGEWDDIEVQGPDTTDRQTVITLAKMASNAYILPGGDDWYPVGKFNESLPVGWEDDADGLRGHVFADAKNETVVIAIKGTSAGVLGSGGPTAKNDKYNDNLLFSCCCARVDFSWSTVCDCYAGGYKCQQSCLEKALVEESVYATVGTNLYNNVTYMYPNANIWLVGHSLGGSVSALIGLAFGAPVVTFEAPGDRLPARRLHLPQPPGMPADKSGITHVYHTADPIPMGACTGAYSGCYAAGFALESRCHTGQTILYDTVTVKGWSVDIRTHRIGEVISKVLTDPWPEDSGGEEDEGLSWTNWWGWKRRGPKKGEGDDDDDDDGWDKHGGVPKARAEADCVDCYKWEFGEWDDKGKNTSLVRSA